ncbi:MAG: serine/threonine-protein kinase [Thermoanaerobaculia bacterium]
MGEVVRAEDLSLRQTVALKFLPAALAHDPQALDRVRDEVRMARRVSHRNVCRVHDLGESEGQLFISMEYVDGEDLASLLRRVGRLAGDRALEIARELCAGLAAAHVAGVIHRDLKPANVMLDREGRVRITDFGLASLADAVNADEIAGTPAYMAPEQLAGTGATVRSDLYALGLVLYELLSGRRAFPPAATLSEQLRQRRDHAVIPPGQIVRDLDPLAESAILRCLATRPQDRPDSALAVLAAFSGGDPLKAAVDAGQTPSPSAVAGASVAGVLSPFWAWSCVGAIFASVSIFLAFGAEQSSFERVGPIHPPAVLAVKAEEAMRALGFSGVCTDTASGFSYDDAARRASILDRKSESIAAERRTIYFWHRCSPVPLVPRGQTHVSRANPPIGVDEALVDLDVTGRLLRFVARPESEAAPLRHEPTSSTPLMTFLRLAGLEPTEGAASPPANGPMRLEATFDRALKARVEADFRGERVVSASVFWPWSPLPRPRAPKLLAAEDVSNLFFLVLTAASLPLAYRNLRAGRGDRQGATRLGLVVFLGLLAVLILKAHPGKSFSGFDTVLEPAIAWSLYIGGTVALFYLALEPIVRRVWPERLVSWTRLLSGNGRDPMVARDVLLGMATFYGLTGLFILMARFSGVAQLPAKAALEPLFGLARCASATALSVVMAVRLGLVFLLLLLLLRALERVRWLATVIFFAIVVGVMSSFMMIAGVQATLGIPLALVFGAAILLLIVRVGLLAITVVLFFGTLTMLFPNVARLSGWSAFCLWWLLAISFLGAAYGVYYSTGGRPFGDRPFLEP